jgi:hypothetical protein
MVLILLMLKSSIKAASLLSFAFALVCLPAQATLMVNGDNTYLFLTGSNSLPAVVYGYGTGTVDPAQSLFSTNFLVNSSGVGTSPAITFSSAPVTTLFGNKYFAFVLDIQEPGSGTDVFIETLTLSVNNVVIWQSLDNMHVNAGAVKTLTHNGNGADMAVLVPVAAFNGLNLTGASTFVFTSTQSSFGGGSEEWEFTNRGIPAGTTFFPTNAAIEDIPGVPEPTSIALALTGLGLIAFRRKIKA